MRVHGNHTTPDADVLALAGLTVGSPVSDDTLRQAEEKLRRSGRFADVEVRKRFRSIENPSDILVILLVDEHPGISQDDLTPGPMKRFRSLGMWLPIVDYADGYGFTYGARLSFVDALGKRSRISVPAIVGWRTEDRRDVDRSFERGLFTRVEGGFAMTRRENPRYELGDTREEGRARIERAFTPWLRTGGGVRITNVQLRSAGRALRRARRGRHRRYAHRSDVPAQRRPPDATVEQLASKATPCDAVDWRRPRLHRPDRFERAGASRRDVSGQRSVPLYEQPLLGGTAMLRGYDFGYRGGDNLAAFSAELRVPLTSPLNIGRFGVKAFIDAGTVLCVGKQDLRDQHFDRGHRRRRLLHRHRVSRRARRRVAAERRQQPPRWHFGLGVTF